MEKGSFYVFVPNRNISRWIPLKKKTSKAVAERLDKVHAATAEDDAESDGIPGLPTRFIVSGGGAIVRRTVVCTPDNPTPSDTNTRPVVYSSGDIIVVFSGCLRNVEHMEDDIGGEMLFHVEGGSAGINEAQVIFRMYNKFGGSKEDQLVLLSELQGAFAFAVFDASENRMFCARDPSGEEALFHRVTADGDVEVTNSRSLVAALDDVRGWTELMPGHFTSGRKLKPVQFALNEEELEVFEAAEENDNLDELFRSSSGTPGGPEGSSSEGLSMGASFKHDVMSMFDKAMHLGSTSKGSRDNEEGSASGGGSEEESLRRKSGEFLGGLFGSPRSPTSSSKAKKLSIPSSDDEGGGQAEIASSPTARPAWDIVLPPASEVVEWRGADDELPSSSWKDLAPGVPLEMAGPGDNVPNLGNVAIAC